MKSQLVITATGQDRPGIVARITAVLVEHGANLEDSRMALLGGEFAAIMLVSVEAERVDSMSRALDALASEGITVSAKQTAAFDPDRFRGYLTCQLNVSGADHEGIVHEIARFLKDQSINIQSMDSKVVSAPVTGTPLFCMRATVQVPPALSISDLRRQLTAVGDKESVDIELIEEPVASPRA